MSKFCPSCGEELVDRAKFCKNCGMNLETMENNQNQVKTEEFKVESVEKDHNLAIVIGYILSILASLLGIIVSIYLLTRGDSPKAKKHGKYILIISIVFWILPNILRLW